MIWVDGPSDKIIIQEWLRKIGVSQRDLNQISILYYGGSSIYNIRFLELRKLNHNCVVIQDSDRRERDQNLKDLKIRVKRKCEGLGIPCWTTERREIENYFSKEAINEYHKKHSRTRRKSPDHFDDYTSLDDIIRNYSRDKPHHAREIVRYMTEDQIMRNKELVSELEKIKDLIHLWNENAFH